MIRLETGRRAPAAYRVVRWLNKVGAVSDERLERERRNRGSADYRAATGVMRDILVKVVNESYEGQLSRISNPVHLVWGEDDGEVPLSVAEAASALLSDCSLEVLSGVGHLVPIQAPEALRAVIDRARV